LGVCDPVVFADTIQVVAARVVPMPSATAPEAIAPAARRRQACHVTLPGVDPRCDPLRVVDDVTQKTVSPQTRRLEWTSAKVWYEHLGSAGIISVR
jgi:hypothetical protein